MDWWLIIKWVWGGIGFGLALLLLTVVWRARGIVAWNRSIQKELKDLAKEAETTNAKRTNGIRLIQNECDRISYSLSPQIGDIDHLRDFIRSIAACFFPKSERPELQVSLGHLIQCLNDSLTRFDRIVQRPGLNRLKSINIRTIRNLYRWSSGVMQHPTVKWYVAHRVAIRRVSRIRFLLLIDPFSWALLLSRKIVTILLVRNLVLDITVYTGKLALNAFDSNHSGGVEETVEILEQTLEDLSHIQLPPAEEHGPVLLDLRRKLVGFSSVMLSNPSWKDWKSAVWQAADHIARNHFPDSDRPLEEASVGPLLQRTRSWLSKLGKGDNLTIVRYVYKTRLETLFHVKDVTDLVLTPTVRSILQSAFDAYGWLKWPLVVYRWITRFSFPRAAVDVGWVVGKKSVLVLIYGRTFDQACRELDWVYRISAGGEAPIAQKKG